MKIKKYNDFLFEGEDSLNAQEELADKYEVRDFKIESIDVMNDKEITFVGYN